MVGSIDYQLITTIGKNIISLQQRYLWRTIFSAYLMILQEIIYMVTIIERMDILC